MYVVKYLLFLKPFLKITVHQIIIMAGVMARVITSNFAQAEFKVPFPTNRVSHPLFVDKTCQLTEKQII